MKRTFVSLAVTGVFVAQSSAVLNFEFMSPVTQSVDLMPGQSAPIYGKIVGVVDDVSSFTFTAHAWGDAADGALFTLANDGTMGSFGYYLDQNTTADFYGMLGTITAIGSAGTSYTNVLTMFDDAAGQSDGENMEIRVQAAPEPTSFAALGVGTIALLRRRRKA